MGLCVKINVVVFKGVNEYELLDMIEWVYGEGMDMMLIEIMLFGDIDGDCID